jgi:hypothetical protein
MAQSQSLSLPQCNLLQEKWRILQRNRLVINQKNLRLKKKSSKMIYKKRFVPPFQKNT